MASIDPFERSRTNTLQDIFDNDPDYQWHIELGEKLGLKYPRKENSDGDKHRRVVTRTWPRDPNGETMSNMADGYSTPNSTRLWGNTLLDFFKANRIPSVTNFIGTCSGSILLGWMKANGELEHAKSEIAWAEAEEPPRLRPAADVMELITARDLMIMMGTCGISMRDDSDDEQEEATRTFVQPFDYKNYPDPWPLVPFSSNPPSLQSQIPFHLLPQTLIVHDPFHLLHAEPVDHDDVDWTSVKDITHTYSLNFTVDSVKESIAEKRAQIATAASRTEPVMVGTLFAYPDADVKSANADAIPGKAYRLTVPPPPPPPSFTAEAHLFISPAEVIGEGNHSHVYRAEWDLPRSIFTKPEICMKCVEEAAREILRTKAGKMPVDAKVSESGQFLRREKVLPGLSVMLARATEERIPTDENSFCHTVTEDTTLSYVEYSGSMSTVHVATVPWSDPASATSCSCPHPKRSSLSGPLPGPAPPTAQVSVAAKLSIPGDRHLKHEAANYQRFGPEFSQHWTGYTLAYPAQEPTPTGAICPIFYGYYSKAKTRASEAVSPHTDCDNRYFSPILLLEDCGTPIDPAKLDFDDRQECAALLLRMHYHGWTQGSFWPRNILMQLGDHGDFPLMKSPNDRRFRLIDFGRSRSRADAIEADRLRGDGGDYEEDKWDKERFDEKGVIGKILNFPYPT